MQHTRLSEDVTSTSANGGQAEEESAGSGATKQYTLEQVAGRVPFLQPCMGSGRVW